MKQILAATQNNETFTMMEAAFRDTYDLLSFPEDSDVGEYLKQNSVEMILLTITNKNQNDEKMKHIMKRILELTEIPIIVLSTIKDIDLEKNMIAMGAQDYLTLPISKELLLHKVKACLELTKLRMERPYMEKYQDAISFSFAELVECRDETTGGHLKNTTRYFELLLQEAMKCKQYQGSIPPEDIVVLRRAAMLHDIGKLGITDDVLHKESTLNYSEFEHMKTHTTLGKQAFDKIIKETGGTRWLYLAKDMAYCHHERWDGTGYPSGLKGEEIPLYARMLTIADVYDALTSQRAYKKAFSHRKAVEIILEGKGSYFDPSLVDIFIKENRKFEELLRNREVCQ